MRVRSYTKTDAEEWDEAVARSAAGTFLHTRRFLSYHGDRFTDLSLICEDGKSRMVGVFPAALKPDDPACVVSHPGATYGGLICCGGAGADEIVQMLAGIIGHYRANGLRRLEYRSVPPHLHASYAQEDLYAIWKLGPEVVRRDLWNVVALGDRPAFSKHHLRAIVRARKGGVAVRIADSVSSYREFHTMLAACLAEHGVTPVHTPEEMLALRDRFARDVALWLAQDDQGEVLAGCWVFRFGRKAWHTQYIASTPRGRERCAAHLMFDGMIAEAERGKVAFLSFGASTENGGLRLNSGLFDFKAGFGAGAVCHDTYSLKLA